MAKKEAQLIVFNWKENPRTLREASRLLLATLKIARDKRQGNAEIVACLPFTYLIELARTSSRLPSRFSFGAQDVFWENIGAFTGEVGPAMLRSVGTKMRYVIVGHSERRRLLNETDEMVNEKVRASLAAGLRVILCVGEPAAVRKEGVAAAKRYVKNQLKKDLSGIMIHGSRFMNHLVVAYEPIWAIGTGRNCPPADAHDMAEFIKKETAHIFSVSRSPCPVLYGGSVDGANIASYLCYYEINGALVGGASLRAGEVKKIIKQTI
ncbi:MAG: triose-phosphate isomerase [Minisyncoccia bacterium]